MDIKKAREFQKNIYFCFIDYAKAFDSVDHNKLENSSRDRILEITQLEQQKEKQIVKNKKKIKELQYNIKHTNICIYRVPEGEEI